MLGGRRTSKTVIEEHFSDRLVSEKEALFYEIQLSKSIFVIKFFKCAFICIRVSRWVIG